MFGMSYKPPIISSIRLENLEISAQQAADDAAQVKIDVQGLHDLTLQYRNDAQFYFEQVQQFQEGDYVTTLTFNDALAAFSFADLASVPSEYNPSAHRHSWTELDNVPLTFAPSAHRHDWSELDNVPAEFEPAEHVHTWQQISGKPATFPPEIHVHDWSEIQNKPAAFMPVAHQHSWADITGKPSAYTPTAHTHEWSEIQNRPDVFHTGNSVNAAEHGIGSTASAPALNLMDYMPNGIYKLGSANTGMTISSGDTAVRTNFSENNNGRLLLLAEERIYYRTQDTAGQWNKEEEVFNTGMFDYAKNQSGTTIFSGSTVSGSNLGPSKVGTWRNVGGYNIDDGRYGLLLRIA